MSQKIKVTAVGYGIGFSELSDDELEEFLAQIEEVNDIMEIEAVSDLTGDAFYEYGFLVDEDSIWLEVDDEDADDDIEELLESAEPNSVDLSSSDGAYWLVYEATEDIDCTITVEKYDPKKFDISKTNITLPNGKLKSIVSIYYEGESFDSADTSSNGRIYIVKKDGEIINF